MKRRILMAAAAVVAALGLTLTASVPAQAVNLSKVNKCVWPGKSTFDLVGDSPSYGYSWRAYSETGWYLGSHWGLSWATPWEDVTVFVTTNDPSYYIVSWCR